MSNLRLQIIFKPSHLLTTVGCEICLLPKHSHLRILNSLELVKVNTANSEPLKIGQSFYLLFHFSQQYIYYDSLRRCMGLTKNLSERTSFKILTDQFDWNSRGKIEMGMLSKYRIILAEHNSKFLVNEAAQLGISSKNDQNSLVSFQKSIYCLDSLSYPIKLTSLQNSLTLCYKNLKASADKKPSICQYMVSLQKKQNADIWALKHVDSNSHIVKSGKQFVFMRDAPTQLKYCLRTINYDAKGNHVYLQTTDGRYLRLSEQSNKCLVSQDILSNILKKQVCAEQSIKYILVSTWLKAQLPLDPNLKNIMYILDECERNFQQFSDVYNQVVVQGLVTEGILLDLQFISHKYSWQAVGSKIISIIKLMIKIKKSLLADLFAAPQLYRKLMQQQQIRDAILDVRISPDQVVDPNQVLQNVRNNIFTQNQIDQTCLQTILLVSPILKALGKHQQHIQLKQFVDHACKQMIPQLQKNIISSYYSIGLKIVKINTTSVVFYNQILSYLSLNLLQSDRLTLQDKLILLNIFLGETGPYVYITTESQTVRKVGHQKRNQNAVSYYIQDILPKNCRFQNYQNKMISVSLIPFHLRVNHTLEITDCKEYIKYLIQSISSYNFDQRPQLFLNQSLTSLYELVKRVQILIAQKSLQYDSITHQISERILKCKKQFQSYINSQILNQPIIWGLFEKQKKLSQLDGKIFILILQIYKLVICSQDYFKQLLKIIKVIDDPSPYLSKSISLFLQRQHQFNPIQTSQKLTELCQGMQGDQLLVIASLIHQNDMYQKVCYKLQAFYNIINCLSLAKNIDQSNLDGQKILFVLLTRRTEWLYSDSQFTFLNNILIIIGGVISLEIYYCYQNYICGAQFDQWSLSFFNLCSSVFAMSPISLKKRFVINYQCQMKARKQTNKMESVLYQKSPQLLIAYIQLLLNFANYHSSKQFIYQIIGDDILFKLLQKFQKNNELKIKIINLMIKTRKRCNEYEDITFSPANLQWLKKGTLFIRKQLQNQSQLLIKQLSTILLKDYTFVMIDFLSMRQQITEHTEIAEDQMLVVEGTNKLLAFEIIDMIEETAKNEQIERTLLDKIQRFQNQYKINVNSMELARVAIQEHKEQAHNQDFVYNYMLEVRKELLPVIDVMLGKVSLQTFITILIKLILQICFRGGQNMDNLQLLLQYLHCIVSNKSYIYTQNDIKLLYLGMKQLSKNKKLKHIALLQNIIRKTIWIGGELEVKNQMLIQAHIMGNKAEFNDFMYECIGNYMMFSPTYSSTLNYFNRSGQKHINWTVTCYISMLRFLIGLCKSLQLKFKQIFSESQVLRKQFIGSLIELNQQHISQLARQTSDTKLTLIVYQIQLINNLLRGPVQVNIQTAIKFNYDSIVSLIKIADLSDDNTRLNTFKIIVQLKKLVAQAILILAPFQKFTDEQVRTIQEGLIMYYNSTVKLVGDKLDKVIQKYTKQNKNKIEVMNFDLSLNLFYGLIRIYEKSGNLAIKRLRTQSLRKARLTKAYNKKFKMLYQIYRILTESLGLIARNIYNCCKKTATEIDEAMRLFDWSKQTHQQHLQKAFAFFVKNVSSVQIQVGSQIQTIYFLLMKQTKCYNASIRKQLHRKVGLGERQYRLTRFIQQSNHVILRLEIEKSIKQFTQRYKPIQIIIKNRQLWKSMNFLCACLLNFIFLDLQNIPNADIPLYFLRVMSYIFCIFLYMIYFIQNLPLKRRLAHEMAKKSKQHRLRRIKSCLQIFNDKTLWFATIYFVVISLSIYHLGFVCLLMIDFFVRFKISKKVTQIVTRPIVQILLIILISVQFAFIFTCYEYFIHEPMNCVDTATCIQFTYDQYLGLYKNAVDEGDFGNLQFRNITDFFFTFFTIMINFSLIIGVLLYEKKAKDTKNSDWQFKVKQKCYICDNERNIVDRTRNDNKGFFEHIEQEHNLWSYIFYLIYLKNKELEKLNVIQNMVMNQWKNNRIDWLPKTYRTN